jgi:DNA polymerase III alpha subunit (gram-positive type)
MLEINKPVDETTQNANPGAPLPEEQTEVEQATDETLEAGAEQAEAIDDPEEV